MIAFAKPGAIHTDETLEIAISAAKQRGLELVIATSQGRTALCALEKAKEMGFSGPIVAVTLAYGYKNPGENRISEETFQTLRNAGVRVVTAAHALSGAERGISSTFGGVYPVEIIAAALRMLGQGVKVSVETSLMALDAGAISYGKPVVCVAGTGGGADTCCIVTPSYTATLLKTKINEILCKPSFLEDTPNP